MGFFTTLFGGSRRRTAEIANGESNDFPSDSSYKTVMDGDTSSLGEQNSKKYVTLSAATGYPIDTIYEFVLRDLENEGYNDALVNTDMTYCLQKEEILRNSLNLMFERIMLIYKEKMRKIEMHSRLANDALLSNAVASLSATNETLREHMTKIAEMQQRANADDETFLNMIASYRRGFKKGLVAACEQLLNNNQSSLNLIKDETTE